MSFFGAAADIARVVGGGAGGFGEAMRAVQAQKDTDESLRLEQERIDTQAEQAYLDRLHKTREGRRQRDFDASESAKDREAAAGLQSNRMNIVAGLEGMDVLRDPDGNVLRLAHSDNIPPLIESRMNLNDAQANYYNGFGRQTGGARREYTLEEEGNARIFVGDIIEKLGHTATIEQISQEVQTP